MLSFTLPELTSPIERRLPEPAMNIPRRAFLQTTGLGLGGIASANCWRATGVSRPVRRDKHTTRRTGGLTPPARRGC